MPEEPKQCSQMGPCMTFCFVATGHDMGTTSLLMLCLRQSLRRYSSSRYETCYIDGKKGLPLRVALFFCACLVRFFLTDQSSQLKSWAATHGSEEACGPVLFGDTILLTWGFDCGLSPTGSCSPERVALCPQNGTDCGPTS